ncbi:two-component system sensor histidine kinase TctE [Duganella sp. 1411]|uniref:sensor histidine kinase n=1 Tax=Duganella sp. 1411 TaxID=2806572 RepID=UPI001AE4BD5B|nr:HAMP domain-containing sensor histidine kinase [Duganella sp. 1411]MBP1203144.1 two-component system sensor histidine kinase TctE [Duganella sp. 1411]
MTSIRVRLLKTLIVPILLINLAGGALAYMLAWLPTRIVLETGQSEAPGQGQGPAGATRAAPTAQIAVDNMPHQIRQAVVRGLVLLEVLIALACIGLIWFSVSNGLRPLNRLRAGLNARDGDDLAPIALTDVPYELEPVVSALNGLLDKVGDGAKARQDFLANVAHQLRTPLAGLKTQLEWLGARHAEPDTAHSVKLMLSATERMIRQTNQLLALARAEPNHFERTRLEPVALNLLVEDAIQSFVEQATRKGIDIGFDLRPVEVNGDRFLLRDLIDNLIDNAIRYTPAGGTVTVGCRPDAAGNGWLTVEDSGPGIPAAKREQVFSRYVRLDDKSHGSGLGLAIVRDIAVVHGAGLDIGDAAGGQGALFTVRFPNSGVKSNITT